MRGGARPNSGGRRPGAGRKPGVHNKATQRRQALVAASGITPLDFMLTIMRDPAQPIELQKEMAKAAAPYVHPRLSAVEQSGPEGGPVQPNIIVQFVDSSGRPLPSHGDA